MKFLALPLLLLLTLTWVPLGSPFTVIMPDSGTPSALVDTPQTRFSINKNGARTDPQEQEAVYKIMKATGNGWATDIPDVCRGRWHGIECMPDKDEIFHIVSLSFGALSDDTAFPTCDQKRAFISSYVTKLPHLRTLFFYRCFGSKPQPIPAFLGHLGPTLQTLVLRENGHVGPIPNELGNLTCLRVLDLHKNNLNGSIPVSLNRVSGLRSLDLSGNRLTGRVPSLVNFPILNILDLSQNLLTGSIPSHLVDSHPLIKMDLSRNCLSGPIPESIGSLKNLILMDLSYNQFSGPIPTALENLNSLQALILKGNQMASTTIPANVFSGLKDLMILVLSDMSLQGPIPESLGRLPNIRVIYLDQNRLNGSISKSFEGLKDLRELRLNDNQLTGRVPFSKEMVWKMGRKLRLNNNLGLCYDPNTDMEEVSGSSFVSYIGYCEMQKPTTATPAPTKTTVHLTSDMGRGLVPVSRSSAPTHHKSYVHPYLFLLILYFILCFL